MTFVFTYILVSFATLTTIFVFLKCHVSLDNYVFSCHLTVSLMMALIVMQPVFAMASIIDRLNLLDSMLIQTFEFNEPNKIFSVIMVSHISLQKKLIKNASLVYFKAYNIMTLLNSTFGVIVRICN